MNPINAIGSGGRTCVIPLMRVGRDFGRLVVLIGHSPASSGRTSGVDFPFGQDSCVQNIVRSFILAKSPYLHWVQQLGDGC